MGGRPTVLKYAPVRRAVGLDLDQDGRSFAVLDADGDGDPDLAVMAARQTPQLRLFRNDFGTGGTAAGGQASRAGRAALAIRLTGKESNRDAIGARVTLEAGGVKRIKTVHAGSGFLSQHSKELLFGLGASDRVDRLTVAWPSGRTQEFTDVPANARLHLAEGGTLERTPLEAAPSSSAAGTPAGASRAAAPGGVPGGAEPPRSTWLYEPFSAPEFSLPDVGGETRSLSALRGRPAVLLFWSAGVAASRAALDALGAGSGDLARAGVAALAIAVETPEKEAATLRTAAPGTVPVVVASRELGLAYAILNRHLFMNRQAMRLPTAYLLDAAGRVVKAYRDRVDVRTIVHDAAAIEVPAAERFSRAVPFAGTLYAPPPQRNYLTYGRELLDQGLEAAALVAFERAAEASPSASTLYRLGTLLVRTGESTRARAAFERALALQPDLSEANNDLGALLAQAGQLEAAIERFRAALASTPEYPDALNNLGYALLLTGREQEARGLYEKALALQSDFPEALNNLGLLLGRAGELAAAERYFRDALARREDYGEAANNLALVLVARGDPNSAIQLLEKFIDRVPRFEDTYVTLAKIHLSAGRSRDGIVVLERLLQRNPTHPVALALVKEWKPR